MSIYQFIMNRPDYSDEIKIHACNFLADCEKKAREKVLVRLFQEKMLLECQQNSSNVCMSVKSLYDEVKYMRENVISSVNPNMIFLTIRPREGLFVLDDMLKMAGKLHNKKWLEDYLYVIEQSGANNDERGKGIHLHTILIRPEQKKYSHFIRELKSTASMLGDTSLDCYFNVRIIKDEADLLRRVKYIISQKVSTEQNDKANKQLQDITYRKENNIQTFYLKGDKLKSYVSIEQCQQEKN